MEPKKTVKGLVLAGGGAKGSYQVGVWRALMELGQTPDLITGTSVGCLNGAMFVLDAYETARDMWLTIGDKNVMVLPEDDTPGSLHSFWRSVVTGGGLDVTPLEQIVERVLDEYAMRRARVGFGLVTVEKRGLRARELTLDEIPQGRVKDYLMASAACFPALRAREIDGKEYLDGGYSDNMPFGLAKRMGATELLCVNVDGVGITRPNFSGLPTITVESHWDLGEILRFSPPTARRNIELGYYDTLRAFDKIRGTAYAIDKTDAEEAVARFRVKYDRLSLALFRDNPTLALTELTALTLFGAKDKPLAPLEIAAEAAKVEPTLFYTTDALCEAFLAAYDPAEAVRFAPLFEGGIKPAQAAAAGLVPNEFMQALVFRALTATEEPR